jgi:ABC-type uncharacterized transport system involved in gliding motility auxiliary subunit
MLNKASSLRKNRPTPALQAAEKRRTSGIHLVRPVAETVKAAQPRQATPKLTLVRASAQQDELVREDNRMSTLALVGTALIVPTIWLGHAVLAWLNRI